MRRRDLLALALVSCACTESAHPDKARVKRLEALSETGVVPATLRIAITPSSGEDTAALLAPLVAFLTERLSMPVSSHTAKSYDDLARMVNDIEVDIGIFSPAAFVEATRAGLAAIPIATATRRGSPTYLGYLVARGKSPAPRLEEMKGKRIAWVERSSTSGYLYPRAMMRARGLDPDTFFSSAVMSGDHRSAIRAVLEGEVDLAAVASPFVDPDGSLSTPDANDLLVVAKTQRIPLDCIVVHKSIQRKLGEDVQRALFALSSDEAASRDLARTWGLSGFVRPMEERYQEVATVIERESG